jgi:hypothetical protein
MGSGPTYTLRRPAVRDTGQVWQPAYTPQVDSSRGATSDHQHQSHRLLSCQASFKQHRSARDVYSDQQDESSSFTDDGLNHLFPSGWTPSTQAEHAHQKHRRHPCRR